MMLTMKPFADLTAADLMSRQVVLVPREMSLKAAARLLSQAEVSGAPVVDDVGRCVGVLSATDFMHLAEHAVPAGRLPPDALAPVCSDWQVVDLELLPGDEVEDHMTDDPVTVPPTASVTELARLMIDAHIHRVIVVDAEGRPVGVVSSTDIIAAVAQARGR